MTYLLWMLAMVPVAWVSWMFLWPPFPRIFGWSAWRLGLLGVTWCGGTIAMWIWLPQGLPAAALVGVGLGGFLARGRVLALLAKGPLPPGSMSFAAGVRGMASRTWYLEQFVRLGPVFRASQFGRPVLCVVGMERICQLMRGHSADLGPSSVAFTESIPGKFLRYMDDSTHSKYGGLFRRALAGDLGEGTEEEHRRRVRKMLSGLATRGSVCPSGALEDHVRQSLDLVLFGMRGDDARSVRFAVLSEGFSSAAVTRRWVRTTTAATGVMSRSNALGLGRGLRLRLQAWNSSLRGRRGRRRGRDGRSRRSRSRVCGRSSGGGRAR